MTFRRQPYLAHRVAWTIAYGAIPTGALIRHKCDNAPCVEHLEIGTQADNWNDFITRQPIKFRATRVRGDQHWRRRNPALSAKLVGAKMVGKQAKLTVEQVLHIRAMIGSRTQREIAAAFGVSRATISFVKSGMRWGHVV